MEQNISASASSPALSPARLAANRENSRLSTGPTSESGKARVRLNGLRHGLTGQTVLMPYEDAAKYEDYAAGIVATLAPKSPEEEAVARSIAENGWRLSRARAIEHNIFALGVETHAPESDASETDAPETTEDPARESALSQAQTFLDNARELQLLTVYEGRIEKALRRGRAELEQLQSARRAAEAQALEEAAILAQLADSKGERYDPAADGFGFSNDFLARRIDRQKRLADAHAQFSARPGVARPALRRAA